VDQWSNGVSSSVTLKRGCLPQASSRWAPPSPRFENINYWSILLPIAMRIRSRGCRVSRMAHFSLDATGAAIKNLEAVRV
jgi:hypothetical protein